MNVKDKKSKSLENISDINTDVELSQEVGDIESKLKILSNLNTDENQEIQQNQQGSESYYEL